MARFRCHACGKEFDMGAHIIDNVVLCSDCARRLNEILDDCVYENLFTVLSAGLAAARDGVEDCAARHREDLRRLGMRETWFKLTVVRRLINMSQPQRPPR